MKRSARTISPFIPLSLLAFFLFACEDRFTVDLSDIESENELVVEGFITDGEGPHEIRLTRTIPVSVSATDIPAERGATVQVIDRQGNVHTLDESLPGTYLTNEATFRAEVGNAYQLRIALSNGEEYASDFQVLNPVEPINELWFERGTRQVVDGRFVRDLDVVKLFTDYDTHDEPRYYRYDYFGTYGFAAQLPGSSGCWGPNETPPSPEELQEGFFCYVSETVPLPINVSTYPDPVEGATGFDEILSFDFDIRFSVGFSVEVRKYALTQEYHDFLSAVREQGEFGGSIFDSPPTQIIGNIRNVNEPDRFALGFFSTLAVTAKRTFIPGLGYQPLPERCETVDDIPPPKDCCDCRRRAGSTNVKPPFWKG